MPDPLTIAAGAWAWDKYGKSLTDKAASALKGRWDKFRWNDAAEKYRAKVKKLYGTMQIMGMAEEVPLDDIFTEAYLLDKPTAFSRFDIERLKQASADPKAPPPTAKRVGGLALVKRNKNLFILGKPGAGKTTFLKYIAVQAAEPDKPVIDKVPIFISLKRWADCGAELLPFIEEQFDKCDFPAARPFVEELLKSGGAIVLFDGLDEVNQEGGQRDKQILAINNFIEKYDRTQCLITCRLAASDYSFEQFTYVEIADFTPKQIETFVGNWFRNNEGEKDEEISERFLAEFQREDNKGLRDLARTPLLLTLLCLSFNETLTFPQRRVEIYKEALDALLKKWDSSRKIKRDEVYRKLSLGHKENMLARIAAETFEKNQYFIPQAELERLITDYVKNVPPHDANEAADGENILKAIEAQHGIFVERAHKIYSFSHLTFQEYFTAQYIANNAARGILNELIKNHCADKRWREVFLLTTSLLPDASQFMAIFRRRVDETLKNDEKLIPVLIWSDAKSKSVQAEPWIIRPAYLFVELCLLGGIPDFYGTLEEVYNRNNDLNNAIINPGRVSNNFLNIALDIDLKIALRNSQHAVLEIKNASRHAERLGLKDFVDEIKSLSLPADTASASEVQLFEVKLLKLMNEYRGIGNEWDLSKEQIERFADYLNATKLLRDCLELAYMPPEEKKAMLNSLYLPPV